MNKSLNISNKEALKDKIHEIHNYLRNNGAGYGMNALKVFNLLYGLKKIEEKNLLDKVNLKRPDCEFSYLLKLVNENKNEQLTELILGSVLDSIHSSSIRTLLFYEIPTNIKSLVFAHLIREINKITIIEKTCNVLLSGKIYEYFIGRDETAISELGAYFTDRHIVDYIYQKLDPKINEDGTINSMIDMFGGSGGFTTGYINYLNNKYDVDWTNNINKIYHFDMNEDVIKSAGLEFFCLTGTLPNMNDNIKYKNSFTNEFNDMKFKNVITNPPYGGDKVYQTDTQIKRKKIKDYIKKELKTLKDIVVIETRTNQIKKIEQEEKQEKKVLEESKVSVNSCSQRIIRFARKNKLTGNDKESSSLILIMDMVDIDGTAIGVLKEGVFFNKTYKDIRKCLVENFNVREIISVPQNQFENTSTKTSIVIFDNTTEKTSIVKFSELIVEKYTEDKFEEIDDEIVLTENKDDISRVYDKLISEATKEDILKNSICSLNGKDYKNKIIICGKDYELKKLGDICEFLQKSKRKASDGKSEGKYNFYTSSDKIQKCDFVDYEEECIIVGDGGIANIKMDINFSCSDHNHIIKSIYNKYIYYFLKGNINFLSDGFNGSVLKNLSIKYLQNLEIPFPKDEKKIYEWIDKISKPYNKKNENEQKIKELDNKIKERIKEITEKEECEEVKLGIICDINMGATPSTRNHNYWDNGSIPWVSVTELNNNIIYDTKKHITTEGEQIMKNRKIPINSILLSFKLSIGKLAIAGVEMYCNEAIVYLNSKDKKISQMYLYYILDGMDLKKYGRGTIGSHGNLNKDILTNLQIPIPKDEKLIQKLEPLFKKIEKLQFEIKDAELQYKQLIKELSDESISNNKTIIE